MTSAMVRYQLRVQRYGRENRSYHAAGAAWLILILDLVATLVATPFV